MKTAIGIFDPNFSMSEGFVSLSPSFCIFSAIFAIFSDWIEVITINFIYIVLFTKSEVLRDANSLLKS